MSAPTHTGGEVDGLGEQDRDAAGPATTRVCLLDQIEREGGVTALVAGRAVAVLRTHDDQVFALDNYDPFSQASVLARGIVGTRTVSREGHDEQVPFVASPMYKQAFDLRTGHCLDDETVQVATYAVELVEAAEGLSVHVGSTSQ